MKVKILIAPLLIVSIIALLIWLVYPAYSNGVDGAKEKQAEYNQEKQTLDTVSQKTTNLDSLSTALTNDVNKPKQDVLFKFIPASLKEEDVINNLSYLASGAGLSILNIAVAQPDKASIPTSGLVDSSGQPIPVSAQAPAAVLPDTVKVNFSVTGSYDQIKDALNKIYALERYNSVSSLSIGEAASGSGSASGNSLQASAVLEFALYKKSAVPADPLSPVFDSGNFDWATIQSITDSKSIDVLGLNVDSSGRENPFLP
jgi:Tfp pilus assembly protein PilO